VALYAALLLADAGQADAAKSYLTAAASGIYPEEKNVVDEAKTKIAGASTFPSPTVSPVSVQSGPAPAASPH
jgi:hypothetical protein